MRPATALAVMIALTIPASVFATNNGGRASGPLFGLGDAQPEVVSVTTVRQSGPMFGLGPATVVVYQDCPSGVCPLPMTTVTRSTTTTRQPILRPRTTVQRTVTETCPGGVCPLPQAAVIRSSPVIVSERVVSSTPVNGPTCPQPTYYAQSAPVAVSGCPTCPTYTTTRTVTRQPIVRRYSAQWTFPGDIDSHLMGAPHYVSAAELAGMTYDQKLQLHDSQHNSIGGRSFGVFRQRSRPLGWRFRPFLRLRMGW